MSGVNEIKPRVVARCALLLLCGLSVCAAASAQRRAAPRPTPTPEQSNITQSNAQKVDADKADLAITARVTARELKFDEVPNAHVEFTGQPRRETVWDAARQNLPRPVQPGVTYRDLGIHLVITSVFADIDRIVAEALGEVPRTDDNPTPAPPPSDNPPAAQTPAPPKAAALTAHNTPPARNARQRRTGRPR